MGSVVYACKRKEEKKLDWLIILTNYTLYNTSIGKQSPQCYSYIHTCVYVLLLTFHRVENTYCIYNVYIMRVCMYKKYFQLYEMLIVRICSIKRMCWYICYWLCDVINCICYFCSFVMTSMSEGYFYINQFLNLSIHLSWEDNQRIYLESWILFEYLYTTLL